LLPPVTIGNTPFHFSIVLCVNIASVNDCSINLFAWADAVASTIFCSASIFAFSKAFLAVATFCSATCFSSIAVLNNALKLKFIILKLSMSGRKKQILILKKRQTHY
jgi:hypothetical protein